MATGTGLAGVETAVETVVLPAIEAHGLTLVDLEVRGNGRRAVVRIFVDKPGGVTMSDCQQLSHEVGDLIDVSEPRPEQLRPGSLVPGPRPRAAQGSGAPVGHREACARLDARAGGRAPGASQADSRRSTGTP